MDLCQNENETPCPLTHCPVLFGQTSNRTSSVASPLGVPHSDVPFLCTAHQWLLTQKVFQLDEPSPGPGNA